MFCGHLAWPCMLLRMIHLNLYVTLGLARCFSCSVLIYEYYILVATVYDVIALCRCVRVCCVHEVSCKNCIGLSFFHENLHRFFLFLYDKRLFVLNFFSYDFSFLFSIQSHWFTQHEMITHDLNTGLRWQQLRLKEATNSIH